MGGGKPHQNRTKRPQCDKIVLSWKRKEMVQKMSAEDVFSVCCCFCSVHVCVDVAAAVSTLMLLPRGLSLSLESKEGGFEIE